MKELIEKYEKNQELTDDEMLLLIDFYGKLYEMLNQMHRGFEFPKRDVHASYMELKSQGTYRGIYKEDLPF